MRRVAPLFETSGSRVASRFAHPLARALRSQSCLVKRPPVQVERTGLASRAGLVVFAEDSAAYDYLEPRLKQLGRRAPALQYRRVVRFFSCVPHSNRARDSFPNVSFYIIFGNGIGGFLGEPRTRACVGALFRDASLAKFKGSTRSRVTLRRNRVGAGHRRLIRSTALFRRPRSLKEPRLASVNFARVSRVQ